MIHSGRLLWWEVAVKGAAVWEEGGCIDTSNDAHLADDDNPCRRYFSAFLIWDQGRRHGCLPERKDPLTSRRRVLSTYIISPLTEHLQRFRRRSLTEEITRNATIQELFYICENLTLAVNAFTIPVVSTETPLVPNKDTTARCVERRQAALRAVECYCLGRAAAL